MIKRFKRETVWFATGVLGIVVFAAVVLAVQEHYPKHVNPTKGPVQAGSPVAEISPKENPSSQMDAAASTPTPVLALTPEMNYHEAPANAGSWTPAYRQDSGRVRGLHIPRARSRSSVPPRIVT